MCIKQSQNTYIPGGLLMRWSEVLLSCFLVFHAVAHLGQSHSLNLTISTICNCLILYKSFFHSVVDECREMSIVRSKIYPPPAAMFEWAIQPVRSKLASVYSCSYTENMFEYSGGNPRKPFPRRVSKCSTGWNLSEKQSGNFRRSPTQLDLRIWNKSLVNYKHPILSNLPI